LTTTSATSASKRAVRISWQVLSISEGEILPRERKEFSDAEKRWVNESNIGA
jgi:hypothetical protein